MEIFILNKMFEIYKDFLEALDKNQYYCGLKNFGFYGDHIPDYTVPIIQQFYLLKYMPAYLTEYYLIYKDMLDLNFLDARINILSVGAGCGIDFWGAKFARDETSSGTNIRYTGVDKVNWGYRDDLGEEDVCFIESDIVYLRELGRADYNVIIFPKSMAEFCPLTFSILKYAIGETNFVEDKIVLLSSMRKSCYGQDMEKLAEVIDIFSSKHGYRCLDDQRHYTSKDRNGYIVGLRKLNPSFIYPDLIKKNITSLNEMCKGYIQNGNQPCFSDCKSMSRSPILTASYIYYQVLRLER